jgi:hypothetical protein
MGYLWDFMGFFNGIFQWDGAHFGCFMRLWEEPRIWEITENIEGSYFGGSPSHLFGFNFSVHGRS